MAEPFEKLDDRLYRTSGSCNTYLIVHGDAAIARDKFLAPVEEEREGDGCRDEEETKEQAAAEGEFDLVNFLRCI